jgi:predicted nucleotidyltransferase
MKREAIIDKIRSVRPVLEAEGVRHVAFFGSRARGDFRESSDLDLLLDVDPKARFSILGLVRVERIAGEATGVTANAFMRRSLEPDFMATIKHDIIEVF